MVAVLLYCTKGKVSETGPAGKARDVKFRLKNPIVKKVILKNCIKAIKLKLTQFISFQDFFPKIRETDFFSKESFLQSFR